jgi:hypothetical protein
VALLGGCGRYVFMVGQLEGKTQLVQCFYSCAVSYFIVKLLWLFNNAASLSETDNRLGSVCCITVNREECYRVGCQF